MSNQVTIEVEYSLLNRGYTHQWTYNGLSPLEAKRYTEARVVPGEATIHRLGCWTGGPSERPEGGHESGIFEDCPEPTQSLRGGRRE